MDKNALGINAGVRIEGEVTPEKLILADQFHDIFQQENDELESIYSGPHSDLAMDFVKEHLSPTVMAAIKKAPPLSLFTFGKDTMIKTADGKLEGVPSYCFRLEQVAIGRIRRCKEVEEELAAATATISIYRKKLTRYQTFNPFKSFFLKISDLYSTIKNTIINQTRSKNG